MRAPTQRPLHRLLLGLVLAAAAVSPAGAHAQSLGVEAGVAGVEDFTAQPSVGATLFLPFTSRLRAAVSYSQWTGCPDDRCGDPRTGYGNRGLNVIGLFRVLGEHRGTNASVGAGAGWYEMRRLREGRSDRYYQDALTFSGEVRVPVAFNSTTYLRGDLSIPTDESEPRWGFVRLGVDVDLF
jgi:hypothetical protein